MKMCIKSMKETKEMTDNTMKSKDLSTLSRALSSNTMADTERPRSLVIGCETQAESTVLYTQR